MAEVHEAAADLIRLLALGSTSLATAESLTGGGLGALLTGVPGASAVYVGGVVAYAPEVKVALLGVPPEVVETDGVVSARCAAAMATGVRSLLGADLALSTTGVAGPDASEGKPPGTVFVAAADGEEVTVRALLLTDEAAHGREAVREATCRAVIDLARARLSWIAARNAGVGG